MKFTKQLVNQYKFQLKTLHHDDYFIIDFKQLILRYKLN